MKTGLMLTTTRTPNLGLRCSAADRSLGRVQPGQADVAKVFEARAGFSVRPYKTCTVLAELDR